jgi:hypothetical protein
MRCESAELERQCTETDRLRTEIERLHTENERLLAVAELAAALSAHIGYVHGYSTLSGDYVPEYAQISMDTHDAIDELVQAAHAAMKSNGGTCDRSSTANTENK